ncbi:MAG: FHA domain-containing protein, partial [Planctomycetes bacterium]|nr:FHA domain-containing protein [Planctomycetota bacterium]
MTGKLEILKAPKGHQKDVTIDGPITIGRASDNDVVIRDKRVSRHHCVIEPVSGGVRLRDVGSSLGTYVNRQRVTEQLLRDGDRILLGKSRLRYVAQAATAGRNGVADPDLAFEDDEPIQVTEADDSAAPLPIDPEDSALPIDDEPAADIQTDNDEVDGVGLANALDSEDRDLSVEGVFDADDSDLEQHADSGEYIEPGAIPPNAALLPVSDELSGSPALTPEPADAANASIASDEHAHREELKAAEARADELQESLETVESRAAELEVNFQEAETRATQATGEHTALRAEHASCEAEFQRLLSSTEEQLAIARDEDAAARAQSVETTEALKTALVEAEAETVRLCEALAEVESVTDEHSEALDEQERRLKTAQDQREQEESDLRQKIADATEAA